MVRLLLALIYHCQTYSIYFNLVVRMLQGGTFTVGACLSLSDILDIFEAQADKGSDNFNELKKYLYRVASSPIRNVSPPFFTHISEIKHLINGQKRHDSA